jgi:integrase
MPRKQRRIPWLVQRGNDVYYVMWYDAGKTHRLSLGTTDPVEAQARYAQFLAGGSDTFKAKPQGLTVEGALDDYFREHVCPHVVDRERAEHAIRHLVAHFGTMPLAEVDIPATRAYADARRAGRVGGGARRTDGRGADSTIRRELIVLQAAANHAAKWRRIDANQMPRLELPRETPRTEVWLTKEQLNQAMAAATGKLAVFMAVAYYTGARRASVENLKPRQVDLRHGRINLTGELETDNERRSNKRRPVVPIDPRLRPILEEQLYVAQTAGDFYLFGEHRNMYRPFRSHMEALGLPANPHVLRHSRATHLLQDGVPIYDVARLLGDTIQTVERVYGHHSADHLATTLGRSA